MAERKTPEQKLEELEKKMIFQMPQDSEVEVDG